MKFLLVAGLVLGSAAAQAATYTTEISCAQAQRLVDTQGAIVLHSSPYIYDRYVAHQGYCSNAGDETTRPAYVPTRDTAQCWVGYYCAQSNRGSNGG